jgi:hypothetical protein
MVTKQDKKKWKPTSISVYAMINFSSRKKLQTGEQGIFKNNQI